MLCQIHCCPCVLCLGPRNVAYIDLPVQQRAALCRDTEISDIFAVFLLQVRGFVLVERLDVHWWICFLWIGHFPPDQRSCLSRVCTLNWLLLLDQANFCLQMLSYVMVGQCEASDMLTCSVLLSSQCHVQSPYCRYVHARSRAQALCYFRESSRIPDLVLLDASLPDASGIELLAELRSRFSYQQLPIIMFTARQTERSIVAALEAGANDYVAKPFRRAELLARIRMHLRGNNYQRNRMMWATGGMFLEGSESDRST